MSLAGKVALVAGGTRGAGRGIAVELGAAGGTVYAPPSCSSTSSTTWRSSVPRRSFVKR
ncbi:MAG: short-chain dehydrogenase, partial [Acidobacteria bacterium]|nr:short-chain dehydrogenase [Acidobacteriota bacterium]